MSSKQHMFQIPMLSSVTTKLQTRTDANRLCASWTAARWNFKLKLKTELLLRAAICTMAHTTYHSVPTKHYKQLVLGKKATKLTVCPRSNEQCRLRYINSNSKLSTLIVCLQLTEMRRSVQSCLGHAVNFNRLSSSM